MATSQREMHKVTSQLAYRCGKSVQVQKCCVLQMWQERSRPVSLPQQTKPSGSPHSVRQVQEPEEVVGDEYPSFHLSNKKATPYKVKFSVDNCPIEMKIDTGAVLSLVSEATFKKTWTDRSMEPSQISLCLYSGEPIAVVGEVTVTVRSATSSSRPKYHL